MLEIGKSGSVRGVDALCMAECCDTPQSKEGSNREYKVCLSIRAIVHLLDSGLELMEWMLSALEVGEFLSCSRSGQIRVPE